MILIWFAFALVFIIGGVGIVIKGKVKVQSLGKEFTGTTARIIGVVLILFGIAIPIVLYSLI